MKRILLVAVILCMVAFAGRTFAQEKGYKDGTVWEISFIKTSANMTDDYVKSLKGTWKAMHDEAVKEGLLVSYKILAGAAANPEDWDVMLMTEYKNLASMEGQDAKWDAISKKVIGGEDAMKKLNENRMVMRTIYGSKMMREVLFP
ncbi:MAG: hypothetical protein WCO63_07105 [Bacteroidota bacterium]